MRKSIEREPIEKPKKEEPKELSILEEEDFKEFIKREEERITPEDLKIIEELSCYPKKFFVEELHNLFNLSKEGSEDALKRGIKHLEELIKKPEYEKEKFVFEKTKEFLNLFLKITEKFGWEKSHILERHFEERENQINYYQWLDKHKLIDKEI